MKTKETNNNPLYSNVKIKLTGEDGNAFSILGRTVKAARRAGVDKKEIDKIVKEATSGNYDNLLVTIHKYFSVQ